MKTATDFRRALGEPDERFRYVVRQTLMDLECEEETPVKKKISLGLLLAVVMVLLSVGAYAASQWGILAFADKYGQAADPDQLITQTHQEVQRMLIPHGHNNLFSTSDLLNITVEEILYDDGFLYAALLIEPKQEKTLVIADELQKIHKETESWYLSYEGRIPDINAPGSMKYLAGGNPEVAEKSVKEYAQEHGFEQVVRFSLHHFIQHADYELMENGSLRMIAQMEYHHQAKENHPDEIMSVTLPTSTLQYTENGQLPDASAQEHLDIQITGPIYTDSRSKHSLPQDAHDIAGYRGYIQSVSVTPLSETMASVILQIDQQKRHYGVDQMAGPVVVILGENGEELFTYHLYTELDSMDFLAGDVVRHNILMPREGLREDAITIRLQSWRNHTIIYDEYTYTLQ